ncbi:MAG: hypothetical protein WDW36_003272 [Sanguina aurantia]
MGISSEPPDISMDNAPMEVLASGAGRHLGINVNWTLQWRASDGAFVEKMSGKELAYSWGYGGVKAGGTCWEMDSSGVSHVTECDDHEALLLATWIRTACWLQPALTEQLELEVQPLPASYQRRAGSAKVAKPGIMGPGRVISDKKSGLISSVAAATTATVALSPFPSTAAPSSSSSSSGSGSTDRETQQQMNGAGSGGVLDSSGAGSSHPPTTEDFVVSIRLKGCRLLSLVFVSGKDWRVTGLQQTVCGDVERWNFAQWASWDEGRALYPSGCLHKADAGGSHTYNTASAVLQPISQLASPFVMPSTPLLPLDTSYDTSLPSDVPVWRSSSGHLLVRPCINGSSSHGYMLLDTGASGFVLSHAAAAQLGSKKFGELFAAGIAGKVAAQFVKVSTWSLGPLTISNAVMMTMDLEGLVRGAPGKVIGIVGYDVFRRAVVELPQLSGPAAAAGQLSPSETSGSGGGSSGGSGGGSGRSPAAGGGGGGGGSGQRNGAGSRRSAARATPESTCSLHLHSPELYPAERAALWVWHPIKMISSLPHIEVRFEDTTSGSGSGSSSSSSSEGSAEGGSYTPGSSTRSMLLMLDSGACGTDIMMHNRGVKELQLDVQEGRSLRHYVRGVGGEGSDSVRVEVLELPSLEMAGHRFHKVRCMYSGLGNGLDISVYSMGLMCGDLMGRLPMVLDYSAKRIGFLKQPILGQDSSTAAPLT